MNQWANIAYFNFISKLVENGKQNPLIKKVFDLYDYSINEREFPILSLLQHYGAPTPLMDWTYNHNVAIYFAIDGLKKNINPKMDIDDYFSVYRINKGRENEFRNILHEEYTDMSSYPPIKTFEDFAKNENDSQSNSVFYISDFEDGKNNYSLNSQVKIRTSKPMTSIYNQNIIPQEGLFIFNPFPNKTLEDIFNIDATKEGWNLRLRPFDCFNIHKDLAEYLRRKIDVKNNINKAFIYPNLSDEARRIKETTFNGLI